MIEIRQRFSLGIRDRLLFRVRSSIFRFNSLILCLSLCQAAIHLSVVEHESRNDGKLEEKNKLLGNLDIITLVSGRKLFW